MSTLSQQPFHVIGRGVERRDGLGHVTGTTEYVDDIRYPGMLHLKMVRNPLVHARIEGIDLSAAEQVPGFVTAITAADVPKNVYTILCLIGVEPDEEQVLAAERARYRGEPIVAIVAESEAAALEAVNRVELDLEAVTLFSSAAVRVVLAVARIARDEGWRLVVHAEERGVTRHVLEVSGLGGLVDLR